MHSGIKNWPKAETNSNQSRICLSKGQTVFKDDSYPANDVSVAVITASDITDADNELGELAERLREKGIGIQVTPWDGDVEWDNFSMVLNKGPWDYFKRLPDFLSFIRRAGDSTSVENSPETIVWNSNKSYLGDLARRNVPTVPTHFLYKAHRGRIGELLRSMDQEDIVIKPAVASGAEGAFRTKAGDEQAFAHINQLLRTGDVLVQPLIASVLQEGEYSLIFFDGEFSHAVRKTPADGDFRVQQHHGGAVENWMPTEQQLSTAKQAITVVPGTPLYARVDLLMIDGLPVVTELELIEPDLFLGHSDGALDRFTDAIVKRARQAEQRRNPQTT